AEAYTWMILLLGFVQTAWPLDRPIVPLPDDPNNWPTVDVYIPTYNEPLSVVKPTVFAAQSIDWPSAKLRVYLLDDGRRPEFAAFAAEAGIDYLTRDDNLHAKAGNINRALPKTHGEYIAIFDCDHVPTRSFLQTTMGVFLRDP
ncbi:glycosyltransferase, partial [Priestia megaterium]|nr:glycosyltransferase [Priestia megaterium]